LLVSSLRAKQKKKEEEERFWRRQPQGAREAREREQQDALLRESQEKRSKEAYQDLERLYGAKVPQLSSAHGMSDQQLKDLGTLDPKSPNYNPYLHNLATTQSSAGVAEGIMLGGAGTGGMGEGGDKALEVNVDRINTHADEGKLLKQYAAASKESADAAKAFKDRMLDYAGLLKADVADTRLKISNDYSPEAVKAREELLAKMQGVEGSGVLAGK